MTFLQAALHKIATACGTEELQQRGACDLVENRLLDVFLEYSSRPESYVWQEPTDQLTPTSPQKEICIKTHKFYLITFSLANLFT
jgi:hypothetical protein